MTLFIAIILTLLAFSLTGLWIGFLLSCLIWLVFVGSLNTLPTNTNIPDSDNQNDYY